MRLIAFTLVVWVLALAGAVYEFETRHGYTDNQFCVLDKSLVNILAPGLKGPNKQLILKDIVSIAGTAPGDCHLALPS